MQLHDAPPTRRARRGPPRRRRRRVRPAPRFMRETHLTLPPLALALRPLQWTKNGLLFAALVFDQKLFQPVAVLTTILAFIAFACVSSAVYLVNDLRDREQDRAHPTKRLRPIAAGTVGQQAAIATALLLGGGGLALSLAISPGFLGIAVLYLGLMLGYSYGLKRVLIVDVLVIATGFVIRAAAGAIALAVEISPWLLVCSFLLALLLGFGKRRHERLILQGRAALHRRALLGYSPRLLDQLIATTAAATVIAYAVYTFDAAAVPANHAMMLTIPFVVYAIFRYLHLLYAYRLGGSPEVLLVADRPLLTAVVCWGVVSVAILYGGGWTSVIDAHFWKVLYAP